MTFTYLGTLATDLDKVRFEIQDTTSTGALFTDEEINAKLAEHSDNVFLTAAALFDVLAARCAGDVTFKTDDQQFNQSDLAKQYAARAEALRARASGGLGTITTTRADGYSDDLTTRDGAPSTESRSAFGDPSDLP